MGRTVERCRCTNWTYSLHLLNFDNFNYGVCFIDNSKHESFFHILTHCLPSCNYAFIPLYLPSFFLFCSMFFCVPYFSSFSHFVWLYFFSSIILFDDQRFSSILLEGLKDGGAKNNMIFSFENCGNMKMTGTHRSTFIVLSLPSPVFIIQHIISSPIY